MILVLIFRLVNRIISLWRKVAANTTLLTISITIKKELLIDKDRKELDKRDKKEAL